MKTENRNVTPNVSVPYVPQKLDFGEIAPNSGTTLTLEIPNVPAKTAVSASVTGAGFTLVGLTSYALENVPLDPSEFPPGYKPGTSPPLTVKEWVQA